MSISSPLRTFGKGLEMSRTLISDDVTRTRSLSKGETRQRRRWSEDGSYCTCKLCASVGPRLQSAAWWSNKSVLVAL